MSCRPVAMYDLKPRPAPRHDCGALGMLTVGEISNIANCSRTVIKQRIAEGITGEALTHPLTPRTARARHTVVYREQVIHTTANGAISVACLLVKRFTHRAPTVAELRSLFSMSRATAYRWRAAWIDAGFAA